MTLKGLPLCMMHSCPSFLYAMVTGRSMLIIEHTCALLTRLLKFMSKQSNQQYILLVSGLIIVALPCYHLKTQLIFGGNFDAKKFDRTVK